MDPENVIQHSAMKSISIAEKAIENAAFNEQPPSPEEQLTKSIMHEAERFALGEISSMLKSADHALSDKVSNISSWETATKNYEEEITM